MMYTDDHGNLYDHPRLAACGNSGGLTRPLEPGEVIPLPAGASLVSLPGCLVTGWQPGRGEVALGEGLLEKGRGPIHPVGALLPQGFTRLLLPGYRKKDPGARLPLYGYAAVGLHRGELVTAAIQTDEHRRWSPEHYNTPELPGLIEDRLAREPGNPVLGQLARCSLEYHCFTAQNIFYRRWEGGLPVSPACNARCLGCISLQESECCPSPQGRIAFRPDTEEAVAVAEHHLTGSGADEAIISFGQGCEGEPSLEDRRIAGIITAVRRKTAAGTINMNSNGGYVAGVRNIARAGLDSIRISLISAIPDDYTAYYRPQGYGLNDVAESIRLCRDAGVFVSLNLLVLPGYTDRPEQMSALQRFLESSPVDLIQIRNLNIDPDVLPANFTGPVHTPGMQRFLWELAGFVGQERLGSYTPPGKSR